MVDACTGTAELAARPEGAALEDQPVLPIEHFDRQPALTLIPSVTPNAEGKGMPASCVGHGDLQLELLAESEGGPVENLRSSLGELAQRLGTITDLIALRGYIDDHRSAVSQEDVERVDRVLAELILERFDRLGAETYDVRRRIGALSS